MADAASDHTELEGLDGGQLAIRTGGVVGVTDASEKLRVTSAGNVGVGTTAPDMKLSVNGNANNTTGVWAVFSDRRLKGDIAPIHGALETLSKLQGVSFNWKDPKKDADLGRVRGLIAQDVKKVIPEWVTTSTNGYERLQTIGMDAMLIEAIKELREENLALKQRLEALPQIHLRHQLTQGFPA